MHEQARKVAAEDQKLLDPNPARARAVMAEEEVWFYPRRVDCLFSFGFAPTGELTCSLARLARPNRVRKS